MKRSLFYPVLILGLIFIVLMYESTINHSFAGMRYKVCEGTDIDTIDCTTPVADVDTLNTSVDVGDSTLNFTWTASEGGTKCYAVVPYDDITLVEGMPSNVECSDIPPSQVILTVNIATIFDGVIRHFGGLAVGTP